ncbi:MAG: glycosyltransferase [Muribaculaceae bacterium]|nr:glycosyltransferase [Muribaculaceae bacterium]
MPSLSIIIPIYNVEPYLKQCLESIVSQALFNYEVILVDDGSTDKSGMISDEYANEYYEFRVIHQENKGISAARNVGLRHAIGDYILFVDSDDYLVKNSLKYLMNLIEENNIEVLGFGFVTVQEEDNNTRVSNSLKPEVIEVINGKDYIQKYNYVSQAWGYIIKKDILMNHNIYFPEGHMIEDAAYVIRFLMYTKRAVLSSIIGYCYRKRRNSIMNNNDKNHQLRLIDDYLFAAVDVANVIDENKDNISDGCHIRLITRRDNYVFFGIIRAIKIGKVHSFIKEAKKEGLYPFNRLSKSDYPGLKYTVLNWCLNKPWLCVLISKIYCTINNK